MDRDWLEAQLEAGRSYSDIARELECHPSTVSHWSRRYGLTSSHAERHTPRGGIGRDHLAAIVACGLPVRDMADAMGVSPTTVRYWLGRYGLQSGPAERRTKVAEAASLGERHAELTCDRHGPTRHTRRVDGYRCARCEAERVTAWRQRTKQRLVEEAGGACAVCGYDRCLAALQFHHLDPGEKSFAMSDGGLARSFERAREEARKCILLCANCHAEVEVGFAELPLAAHGAAAGSDQA